MRLPQLELAEWAVIVALIAIVAIIIYHAVGGMGVG